jgi:hypothetical protein
MSVGRNLGIGGLLLILLSVIKWVRPAAQRIWRMYRAQDAEQRERHRDLDRIDTYHAIDRAKYFERMAERARERPQDKVQLFDAEHRALGWGLRVGEDPMGNPVVWVPPAVYDVVTTAEAAAGTIEGARFDDGGMEGPWEGEIRDRGRWKLPSEAGWALPPEHPEEQGRWSDQT